MRTIEQIKNKVKSLTLKLKKKSLYENFGEKEIRMLNDYVGDIYADYSYGDRLTIYKIINEFSDWCGTYPGR